MFCITFAENLHDPAHFEADCLNVGAGKPDQPRCAEHARSFYDHVPALWERDFDKGDTISTKCL
jgi:hypothetical protein